MSKSEMQILANAINTAKQGITTAKQTLIRQGELPIGATDMDFRRYVESNPISVYSAMVILISECRTKPENEMKNTITKNEKLALIGLLTVGENLNQQLREVEKAMLKITGEEIELGMGHCSDALYGMESTHNKESDVNRLIARLNLTVA